MKKTVLKLKDGQASVEIPVHLIAHINILNGKIVSCEWMDTIEDLTNYVDEFVAENIVESDQVEYFDSEE